MSMARAVSERNRPAYSHIHVRGDYRTATASKSRPGVPSLFPQIKSGNANPPRPRQWLVSDDNPLTARVT